MSLWIESSRTPWTDVGEGIRRQVLGYGADLMLVRVAFDAGAEGQPHIHVHSQSSCVESGVFEVVIGSERKKLYAGDAFFVPSNTLHSCHCIEEGILIDAFSPMREDFV
ncbi:MAG: cupin domain-containing protein [Tannerellaceae bacterium]|jgi:quercetin dioxygenase-like cupin family protein|nr:cupin domain-containing protein [Tannerellaceae bacterium]